MHRLALIAACTVALSCAAAQAAPQVGKAAPALVVPELNGTLFDLAAAKGKVVIVDVWATWCSPCRTEMPILDRFYKTYHGRGVDVLALSDDRGRDIGTVRRVMKQFAYPAALLVRAKHNSFGRPHIVPMTYVFDRNGILRARLWPGGTPLSLQTLKATVDPLLKH